MRDEYMYKLLILWDGVGEGQHIEGEDVRHPDGVLLRQGQRPHPLEVALIPR